MLLLMLQRVLHVAVFLFQGSNALLQPLPGSLAITNSVLRPLQIC
jgi:hypothetical protein